MLASLIGTFVVKIARRIWPQIPLTRSQRPERLDKTQFRTIKMRRLIRAPARLQQKLQGAIPTLPIRSLSRKHKLGRNASAC